MYDVRLYILSYTEYPEVLSDAMVPCMRNLLVIGLFLLAALLSACQDGASGTDDFTITVDVDGERVVYRYSKQISVGNFLREVGITLGEYDEVNPLLQTQIRDGMRVTVTRVQHREECENTPLPYETVRQPTQGLQPGEEILGQTGKNGELQVCYRIVEKDGVQTSRDRISEIVVQEPRDEIIFVYSEPLETLIPIDGILTFIDGGQAWIIEGITTNLNPLTEDGFLDGRVFDLSPDGKQLLYTRSTADPDDPEFSNELWAILDTTAAFPEPVQLLLDDVRVGQWVSSDRAYTVSYSTARPRDEGAGWSAFNDLYLAPLNPESGSVLSNEFEELIAPNALGSYAYWGRRFLWSPDGQHLAWANADSVGLVNQETGEFETLLTFAEYAPLLERFQGAMVWIPTMSWSDDGHLITTVHGAPYADEAPEDSIIFNIAVIDVESGMVIDPLMPESGIWSSPTYSPAYEGPGGNPSYQIAYFQAREPLNSPGTEYDLVVADRDGSNARIVFPGPDRPGLRAPDPEDGIAWSPTGRQIALIYQNNLWIVDLKTEQSYPITSDGQASRPRWSRTR